MDKLDFNKIRFQYYPSAVWKTTPLGTLSLQQFIDSHRSPKPEILEVFKKIEEASLEGDLKTKDYLKQNNLYYFSPSCRMEGGRSHKDIVEFLPLMIVEFDKINYAEELKLELFSRLKCCIAAYLSPSRKGCKFIIRIPVVKSVEEYKEYYCGMAYYLEKFNNFDPANFNPSLPLFLSYDENILVREDAEEWTTRGGKVDAFVPFEGEFPIPGDINLEDKAEVIRIISLCINRIVDSGHTQLVGASASLGGYVGAEYIGFEEALNLLYDLIEDNEYLSKGVSNYKKTAKDMMTRGIGSPLLLNRHKK